MKCSKCHRNLTKPAAAYGGHLYGPVCARVMGIITVTTRPRLHSPMPREDRNQLDLFKAEAAPAPALHPEG